MLTNYDRTGAVAVDTDVLIIGAGPAGSAAAITLARCGLKVVVVESSAFPRHKAGESLHPGASVLLDQLGLAEAVDRAGFLRHSGHYVDAPGSREFVPYGSDERGPWLGYQVWRAEFDSILLEGARVAGADIWQPCRTVQVILENGRVNGAETGRGTIRSRYLVDSSGGAQWLRKKLHARVQSLSGPLTVSYGYCRGELDCPVFRIREHGWTWVSTVRPELVAWAQLFSPDADTAGDRNELLKGMTPLGRVRGANARWRLLADSAGPGYFVTGDAAASLDPASSHGILRALASGIFAANLICKIDRGLIEQASAAMLYRAWLRKSIEADAVRLLDFYRKDAPKLAACI